MSSAPRIRVPRTSALISRDASLRVGCITGTGAPAQVSTRTSTRSAAPSEQVAHRDQRRVALHGEVGIHRPAGDVDERLRATNGLDDRRQSLRAIDVHVHVVAVAWRRRTGRPAVATALEHVGEPDARQAAAVVRAAGGLQRLAGAGIELAGQPTDHPGQSTGPDRAIPPPRRGGFHPPVRCASVGYRVIPTL